MRLVSAPDLSSPALPLFHVDVRRVVLLLADVKVLVASIVRNLRMDAHVGLPSRLLLRLKLSALQDVNDYVVQM